MFLAFVQFLGQDVSRGLALRTEPSAAYTSKWIARAVGSDDVRAWAIVAGDGHVGNVVLERLPSDSGCALLSIYIGPRSARGRGYASAGLACALRIGATEMRLRNVRLRVQSDNDRAIALYRRHGFVIDPAPQDDSLVVDGAPVPTLHMTRDLREPRV